MIIRCFSIFALLGKVHSMIRHINENQKEKALDYLYIANQICSNISLYSIFKYDINDNIKWYENGLIAENGLEILPLFEHYKY